MKQLFQFSWKYSKRYILQMVLCFNIVLLHILCTPQKHMYVAEFYSQMYFMNCRQKNYKWLTRINYLDKYTILQERVDTL